MQKMSTLPWNPLKKTTGQLSVKPLLSQVSGQWTMPPKASSDQQTPINLDRWPQRLIMAEDGQGGAEANYSSRPMQPPGLIYTLGPDKDYF